MQIIQDALKQGRDTLSEAESKRFLQSYNIPITREIEITTIDGLKVATGKIGFPLVIKGCGAKLSHKTERNLVRVGISDDKEALSAFEEIMTKIEPDGGTILVQEMIKGDRELVAGLIRDPQFGPCVMFGLGGIFTEVLKDICFRPAPLEKSDALQMIQSIKASKILKEVRKMPAADIEQLADILMALGRIGVEHDEVSEIDINPIILNGSKPVAVDGLVILKQEHSA